MDFANAFLLRSSLCFHFYSIIYLQVTSASLPSLDLLKNVSIQRYVVYIWRTGLGI